MMRIFFTLFLLGFFALNSYSHSTGFVHADGKQIHDTNGNNLIMRSIGTGNWMLQEGYMMQTSGVAATQWEFEKKLIESIGEEKTDEFYKSWLDNHFRKEDLDSMKAWGFNTVRPALHYKVFTLPIEEEPIKGQNTWLEDGFQRLDMLIQWCVENEMYVVLDMHGCPGGQGANADISDYDSSKPSLWESEENKEKLIALWRKIAERYADNTWVAGYDLINETNWNLPGGVDLRNLYERLTTAIRQVDTNHMLIIEGNDWANNFTGLTPPWDTNMCYSFHKYWTNNDQGSIGWMLEIRDAHNTPIWLGETGENSNTWFTDCIKLMEDNNIGWSFWPVKKSGINNVMRVETNQGYSDLINHWRSGEPNLTEAQIFDAVMTYSENHLTQNCVIQYDVIDAMIRQPYTTETLPYKKRTDKDILYASDYDFGRSQHAYGDNNDANYHLNTGSYQAWNQGWLYRNDGVDIDKCTDLPTNGYAVGWIEDGEWLQHTIEVEEDGMYFAKVRYATPNNGGKISFSSNGERISQIMELTASGDWQTWQTATIPNIILKKGTNKLRWTFEVGGFNLSNVTFERKGEIDNASFSLLAAETDNISNDIYVSLNKEISSISENPFTVYINNKEVAVSKVEKDSDKRIKITIDEAILHSSDIKISLKNTAEIMSNTQKLSTFTNRTVENNMSFVNVLPVTIEMENYTFNNGLSFEDCSDIDGGKNTSHNRDGIGAEYLVNVDKAGFYKLGMRVAGYDNASIELQENSTGTFKTISTAAITPTGGWQTWNTQTIVVELPAGKYLLRVNSKSEGYNMNWFTFDFLRETNIFALEESNAKIYPNPTSDVLNVAFDKITNCMLEVVDLHGSTRLKKENYSQICQLNVSKLNRGVYFLRIVENNTQSTLKFQKK